MKFRKKILLTLAAVVTLAFTWQVEPENTIPFEWNGVKRIVAVGDIHGAYDSLVSILQQADLVDKRLRWAGGETHLVQVGDMVDRGPGSRKVIELLMKLEKDAERKGGKVHVLTGNHDAMNVVGILDHTSPEEIESYRDRDSKTRQKRVFERRYENMVADAKAQEIEPPSEDVEWKKFIDQFPLGFIEHRLAFQPNGPYGSWILQHNVAILINGILFSHSDWTAEYAAKGLSEVNRRVRAELSGKADLKTGIAFAVSSPLQNRRFSMVPLRRDVQESYGSILEPILTTLKASRIVVGHTMTRGVIEPRFGGMHISVDAGMLDFYGGGQLVALEIEGDQLRAIHTGGKVALPAYLDETNLLDYLLEVASVAPENLAVRIYIIEQYRGRGENEAARRTMEELFRIDKTIPERFTAGVCKLWKAVETPEMAPNGWVAANCLGS
jgi:hypothetical protein